MPLSCVSLSQQETYEPPATDLESVIQSIWLGVIPGFEDRGSKGRQQLSVTADFFALGGTSLMAGIVNTQLRTQLKLPQVGREH